MSPFSTKLNETAWRAADDFASGAVLGSATSAMLMGHSYLVAPAMSLTPLYRLLAALGASLLVRIVLASLGLFWWTGQPSGGGLETEMIVWLGIRWIIGLIGPLVLGWMAWESGAHSLDAIGHGNPLRGRDTRLSGGADQSTAAGKDGVHALR